MRIHRAGLFSSLLLVSVAQFSLIAHAAPAPQGKKASQASTCEQATTQSAMTQCAVDAYKKSDAELNRAYKALRGTLKEDDNGTKKLIAAQRAWIAFRDAECSYRGARTEGGSVHPMIINQCLSDLTRDRTRVLTQSATCEEGDLTCTLPPRR